jgi:hypothetical protein
MLVSQSGTPRIDLSTAPSEELDELGLLNNALDGMERYVQQFAEALHLFDYCLIQRSVISASGSGPFSAWMRLAASDGVMSIWHFRKEMDIANSVANKSPYVSQQLERSHLGDAHKTFNSRFPEFEAIRHAVAHAGELSRNVARHEQIVFSGTYPGTGIRIENVENAMIQDSLQDRLYTCTFEGKIVHCEISGQTIQNLSDVKTSFFAGFTSEPKEPPQPS